MVLLTSSMQEIYTCNGRLNENYLIARKETRIHATPDWWVLRCLYRSMKPLSPYRCRCRGRILNLQKRNDGSLRKLTKDLTPLVKQTKIQNQKDLLEKYKRRNLREEFYKLMAALPLVVFHG